MRNNAERIWKTLFKTVDSIRNYYDRNVPHELRPKATISQMKVMGTILSSPDRKVKVKDIANELGITPGGVSQIVDTLVEEGMLERCIQEDDRRSVNITLSKKGDVIRSQMDTLFTDLASNLLKSISYEKQIILCGVLEEILVALNKEKKGKLGEK